MDWTARIRAAFAASPLVPDDEADGRVAAQLERWRRDAAALRHKSGRAPLIEPPQAGSSTRFAGLVQDVRYAGRLLRRQPRYALLVGLTMALGIGASTFLFSVTYGVLMKPLPWPQ